MLYACLRQTITSIMSPLLQWNDSHLCNFWLCALIRVICRHVDQNAAVRIQYYSCSSRIKLYLLHVLLYIYIYMYYIYIYVCIGQIDGQNEYSQVSDTFIDYKRN